MSDDNGEKHEYKHFNGKAIRQNLLGRAPLHCCCGTSGTDSREFNTVFNGDIELTVSQRIG